MRHFALCCLLWLVSYVPVGQLAAGEVPAALSATSLVVEAATSPPTLVEQQGRLHQTLRLTLRNPAGPRTMVVSAPGADSRTVVLQSGVTNVELLLPAVTTESSIRVEVMSAGETVAAPVVKLRPVRRWIIYLLPHSHVDIGYTKLQPLVEQDQWRFIDDALTAAKRTADYPQGARFKWNVEVLWAVDSYLQRASPEKQQEFVEAVRGGAIGLDALYCSQLTALCRPEELLRLVHCAVELRRRWDLPIDSAMITDVPGYTWGLVPALSLGGVKYLSAGPNSRHRIGSTRVAWDNRPFYWQSPCGTRKVLYWQTNNAYHPAFRDEAQLREFLEKLAHQEADYPYDILYFRQCQGDNAGPDTGLCDFVRSWNSRYAYPRLVIATTSELFREFERRYGKSLPTQRGDFTPYWEDGAASSAAETALARSAAERLVQAETLWALLRPRDFPLERFDQAWRNVLLYDEHTWGAQSYVDRGRYRPGSEGYRAQWAIKRAFAIDADAQSQSLLRHALEREHDAAVSVDHVDVMNTCSWPRSDLVRLPAPWSLAGEVVHGADGQVIPSQRLKTGELAFLAQNIPPLAARRFTLSAGEPRLSGSAQAHGGVLHNGLLTVAVNPRTGAVASLKSKSLGRELVDQQSGLGLNDYFHVPGTDPKQAQRNGPVRIAVEEPGPLVASLHIESGAPGCRHLSRRLEIVDGLERIDICNVLDKQEIPLADLLKPDATKESFHIAFPFDVAGGAVRMDVPWAVVRPETDQLAGACKNWFTVQRAIDISNDAYGITWATIDAPLVELGSIAPQPGTAESAEGWIETVTPTSTLFSYVMNNYWTTNYQHDQPGVKTFRYSVAPHRQYDATWSAKFGIERSQPLIVSPADTQSAPPSTLLEITPENVLITALKPSRDGRALIVRLFGVGAQAAEARLRWREPVPRRMTLSNLAEERLADVFDRVAVPGWGIVTLRVEWPNAEGDLP